MSDEIIGLTIISIVAALSIFTCGYFIGSNKGKNQIQFQAVQENVGEWVIQADGKPTFRFKK